MKNREQGGPTRPTTFALLRAATGMRQTELADAIGVSYATERRLESKGGMPTNPGALQRVIEMCRTEGIEIPETEAEGGNVATLSTGKRRPIKIREDVQREVEGLSGGRVTSSGKALVDQIGVFGEAAARTLMDLLRAPESVRLQAIQALDERVSQLKSA